MGENQSQNEQVVKFAILSQDDLNSRTSMVQMATPSKFALFESAEEAEKIKEERGFGTVYMVTQGEDGAWYVVTTLRKRLIQFMKDRGLDPQKIKTNERDEDLDYLQLRHLFRAPDSLRCWTADSVYVFSKGEISDFDSIKSPRKCPRKAKNLM
jgi:hypothetical protein